MQVRLVAINAKYIHSNLAIRSICAYVRQEAGIDIPLMEFSINQPLELMLSQIMAESPDLLGISCYLWNEELVRKLVVSIKKIRPQTVIVLGGPAVCYTAEKTLANCPADIVVTGEGEALFLALVRAYHENPTTPDFSGIAGTVCRTAFGEVSTLPAEPATLVPLSSLPFVYEQDTLNDLSHRILYFEASRGCPFCCTYCLSGQGNSVRFLPLPQVCQALDFFLKHRVRQVKFVDRTFNANPNDAYLIWEYLATQDQGETNFHFEIGASLLDDRSIALLQTVRAGLFQFEIGVQSTHPPTLRAIRRKEDLPTLKRVMPALLQRQNIHLHLDLIVGLPLEGYEQFSRSFEEVFSLAPHQLQIGFLKLLPGSALRAQADQYGIVAEDHPPYEVLYTDVMSYEEIVRLKIVAQMVETFHNTGRFQDAMGYLQQLFPTVFLCYEAMARFYQDRDEHLRPHTKLFQYELLHGFFCSLNRGEHSIFCGLLKLDLYRHEKAKTLPSFLSAYDLFPAYRSQIYAFYEQAENRSRYLSAYADRTVKQLYRQAHLEVFPFDPLVVRNQRWPSDPQEIPAVHTAILFDYERRDLLGNATIHKVTLPDQEVK